MTTMGVELHNLFIIKPESLQWLNNKEEDELHIQNTQQTINTSDRIQLKESDLKTPHLAKVS